MANSHYFLHFCERCNKETGSIDARVTLCIPCKVEVKQEQLEKEAEAAKDDAEWRKAYKQYKKEQRRLKKQAI